MGKGYDRCVSKGDGDGAFVIEELSRRTGVSVRSLRAYQSRKLLPPPDLRGRTGYYGSQHVERVRLVHSLRDAGMKLDGIARLLDADADLDGRLLDFTARAHQMFGAGESRVTTYDELLARFAVQPEDAGEVLERAARLGLLRERPDGRVDELAPDLLAAGEAAMGTLDLGALEALDLLARLRRHADGVARLYVDTFLDRVWEPFVAAGRPAGDWPRVQRALDDLQALATGALVGTFELVMARRVDQALSTRVLGPDGD